MMLKTKAIASFLLISLTTTSVEGVEAQHQLQGTTSNLRGSDGSSPQDQDDRTLQEALESRGLKLVPVVDDGQSRQLSTTTPPTDGSSFVIMDSRNNNVVDISGGDGQPCANSRYVHMWPLTGSTGTDWQRWKMNGQAIESIHCPGYVLDIPWTPGYSRYNCNEGYELYIYQNHGGNNQKFTVDGDGNIMSVECPTIGLDVQGFGTTAGTPLQTWTITGAGNGNQQFVFDHVGCQGCSCCSSTQYCSSNQCYAKKSKGDRCNGDHECQSNNCQLLGGRGGNPGSWVCN